MKINKFKLSVLLILIFLFAFLYMLIDDMNFGGMNNIQEMIKDELLKEKIKKEIKEKFYNINNIGIDDETITGTNEQEKSIDNATKDIKHNVVKKELDVDKINPSLSQKFFDRLYFSVITGTTLGYGDIYPLTNKVKLLSMVQTLSTIMLILV